MSIDDELEKLTPEQDDEGLRAIAILADEQTQLEEDLEDLEQQIKDKTKSLREISERKLPDTLNDFGLSEIKLADGRKIIISEDIAVGIPKPRIEEAYTWLRDNGFGDVIKREIKASFAKGEDSSAESLYKELSEKGMAVSDKSSVHYQTLKALCKEQIELNKIEIPRDLFGVFDVRKTKITK